MLHTAYPNTYCENNTDGVKLCPKRKAAGIESYHRRNLVYTRSSELLLILEPGA